MGFDDTWPLISTPWHAAAIAFLVALLPIVPWVISLYWSVVSTRRFVKVPGNVVRSWDSRDERGRFEFSFCEYEYEVYGRRYTGSRINFGSRNRYDSTLSNRYPSGSDISVFIDPITPCRSVLVPGVSKAIIRMGLSRVVLGIMLFITVFILVHLMRVTPGATPGF